MMASLDIKTAARLGITYLKESYCTQPFKLANITENKHQPQLQLMMMSSSPGVLDGDAYHLTLDIAAGTHLLLQTQSYQRLFTMKLGATQTMDVNMETGSSFCFIPHPTVPHKDAIYSSVNNIRVGAGCSLIWGEIFACGRHGIGESFSFSKFHNLTKIYKNERLVIHENVWMEPALVNLLGMGQFEGYTHQATLVFLNENCNIKEIMESVCLFLSLQKDMEFGITAVPVSGFVLRLLGSKAELLFDVLRSINLQFLTLQREPNHA